MGQSSTYRIDLFGEKGRAIGRIEQPNRNTPVSKRHWEVALSSKNPLLIDLFRDLKRAVEPPETFPEFEALFFDTEGFVWVQLPRAATEGTVWEVFRNDGTIVGRVQTTHDFHTVLAIGSDRMVLLTFDEDWGTPLLLVLSITRSHEATDQTT